MTKTVMIFSHPNHEIAVMGFIQRTQPELVFLTDGGDEERMNETRQGLGPVVGHQALHFLNHPENDLYQALLDKNSSFYVSLAAQVRQIVEPLAPNEVYCDAVEFYNPVHDISLPVTRNALAGSKAALYEVPLIYQRNSPKESYVLQRTPESMAHESLWVDLNAGEVETKATARKNGYRMLSAQLGGTLDQATPEYIRREQFLKARKNVPTPAPEQRLRYEWRGEALKAAQDVDRVITYNDHYVPLFEALTAA